MDLRDLVKLAGLADVELLNRLEPSVEEEAEGAGFDRATTKPEEEIFDDPLASMGSDADLSLRRYLKAKGDHVTVDENVYPDYTVEDVNEAYAAFKEGKYKSDAQRKAVHAAKNEATIGAPDYNLAIGDYESNVNDANPHTHDYGMFTKKGNEEVGMRVEDAAVLLMDGDYESKEQALKIMLDSLDNLAEDPEFEEAGDTEVRERAVAMFEKMLELGESQMNNTDESLDDVDYLELADWADTWASKNGIDYGDYDDYGINELADDFAEDDVDTKEKAIDYIKQMSYRKSIDEADIELAPGISIKTDKPGIYKGTKTTSGVVGGKSGEAMYMANRVLDAIEKQDPSSSEEAFTLARKFCKKMGCTDDVKKRVYKQLVKMGWTESVDEADINEEKRYQIRYLPYDGDKFKIVKGFTSKEEAEKYAKAENFDELADEWDIEVMNEADIDENAFNQAAAAAARANKDSFEFNGKTYKTKMDKATAHKLDDDVDMLRKLAGLA